MSDVRPVDRRGVDLLLIVRGLAALAVVVWHAEGYKAYYPPAVNVPGRVAVWIFFGISGYVIAYGFVHGRYRLAPSGLGYFYRNRMLRIYPLFIFLTALAWVTEWVKSGHSPIPIDRIPAELFALQWNQQYHLLGVFWTLGIELHYYVLAPLLVLPLFAGRRLYLPLSIAIYAAMVYWCEYAASTLGWSWDGRNVVSNLPHFFAGMVACRMMAEQSRSRAVVAGAALASVGALLAYTSLLYHSPSGLFWSVRGVLLTDAAIVLLVVAHSHIALRPAPGWRVVRVLSFLGVLSYGIYAWHNYIMKYLQWTADHMFVLIALSTAAAWLSYRFVERPALARKKHAPETMATSAFPEPVTAR